MSVVVVVVDKDRCIVVEMSFFFGSLYVSWLVHFLKALILLAIPSHTELYGIVVSVRKL